MSAKPLPSPLLPQVDPAMALTSWTCGQHFFSPARLLVMLELSV